MLAQECADYSTSLRSAINIVKLEGRPQPESMLRAANLFERAAARIADLERWQDDVRSNSPLLARLAKSEAQKCTCPSGDGSLYWPCPSHPPAHESKPQFRLLARGELIQEGDEHIDDDTVTWHPVRKGFCGHPWGGAWQPMRRKIT